MIYPSNTPQTYLKYIKMDNKHTPHHTLQTAIKVVRKTGKKQAAQKKLITLITVNCDKETQKSGFCNYLEIKQHEQRWNIVETSLEQCQRTSLKQRSRLFVNKMQCSQSCVSSDNEHRSNNVPTSLEHLFNNIM